MATVRKHRGRWVADFVDANGRRHVERVKGTFVNAAQEKLATQALLTKRLAEGTRGDQVGERMHLTYAEAAGRFLRSKVRLKPSTASSYRSLQELYLIPYFRTRRLEQMTVSDIERYRNDLVAGVPAPIAEALVERAMRSHPKWSEARAKQAAKRKTIGPRTTNKALTILTMTLNYCCRNSWIDRNPAIYVERLPDPRNAVDRGVDDNVLTPAEIARLLEHSHGVYHLINKTAVLTGMRQGEIFALQWADFDAQARQLHVRRSYKDGEFLAPKTRASVRRVDLPKVLVSDLKRWKLQCPPSAYDLIFPNESGAPQSHSNFMQRHFYPALKRAGIRKVRFHDLRHTFASLMLAGGEDVVRVSRLLGHASPNITLGIYAHMLRRENYGSTDRLAKLIFPTHSDALAA